MEKTTKISGIVSVASLVLAIVWSDMAPIFLLILAISACVWVVTSSYTPSTTKEEKKVRVTAWQVLVWIVVITITLLLVRHWGFLAIVVFAIGYGLWDANTSNKR